MHPISFKSVLLLVCTTIVLGTVGYSKQQDSNDGGLRDVLYNNEQQLAAAETHQDKVFFEKTLDDHLIYVAYNGIVFTKTKILESLNYIDVKRYSVENMKVRPLAADAGLVTYDLILKGSIAGHNVPAKQYASSVWLKHSGKWVLVFHQSTPAQHG